MTAADGLDEIADRLYALPPADFTAARDDEAKSAREAGDRPSATAIGKLRRPTVAAWLVNLLALRNPEAIAELFALGAELRRAQTELRGPELRDLTAQRRAAVHALIREATGLAVGAGANAATLPLVEVETTLTAALADDQLAEVVRAGRLLKAGTYQGFGEPSRPDLRVVPGDDESRESAASSVQASIGRDSRSKSASDARKFMPDSPPTSKADDVDSRASKPGPHTTRRESKSAEPTAASLDARRRLSDAATALAEAEAAHVAALAAIEDRTREVADVEERLARLRQDRLAAHSAVLAAQAAGDVAETELDAARRRHAAAERAAKRHE